MLRNELEIRLDANDVRLDIVLLLGLELLGMTELLSVTMGALDEIKELLERSMMAGTLWLDEVVIALDTDDIMLVDEVVTVVDDDGKLLIMELVELDVTRLALLILELRGLGSAAEVPLPPPPQPDK